MSSNRIVSAGVLLGCGLGAFFDGIALHQLLQWHNMLSSVTPPTDLTRMKYNMLWDGAFHAVAWLVTTAGVVQLFRAKTFGDESTDRRAFAGALLIGWGAFNCIEGLLDHQLLELHHVKPGPGQIAWDIGFLAWGAAMLAFGTGLLRFTLPIGKRALSGSG
jgi:uncharacterized membrane protein